MKMNRSQFAGLIEPVIKDIIGKSYKEKEEQFSRIFDVETMDGATKNVQHIGAFGMWEENSEGNTFNGDSMSEGLNITFTAKRFDKAYTITHELMMDDRHSVFTKGQGRNGNAHGMGAGLRSTLETSAIAVLNNGFTNVGYDGVPLFSASHPLTDSNKLLDNLATGALNVENLQKAIIQLNDQVDEAGNKIGCKADTLIVPSQLQFVAQAIIASTLKPGTDLNDKNVIPALKIEVNDYLTSPTAWFVKDSSMENLKFYWREKPSFGVEDIPNTKDILVSGYGRWTQGYVDVRGIVGSTGL